MPLTFTLAATIAGCYVTWKTLELAKNVEMANTQMLVKAVDLAKTSALSKIAEYTRTECENCKRREARQRLRWALIRRDGPRD